MLSQLNFFKYFQSNLNPFLIIPLLNNSSNIPFQLFILIKKKLFPLKIQLITCIILSIISILFLPFNVFLFQNNIFGIIISAILVMLLGITGALIQNSFYALGSYFPLNQIVYISIEQGFCGIITAILTLIILFFVNTGNDENDYINDALIFFGLALLISIICLISLIYLFKTDYCKYYLLSLDKKDDKNNKLINIFIFIFYFLIILNFKLHNNENNDNKDI